MSGMSSMLRILLYQDASTLHEPEMKRETALQDGGVPSGSPPFIQLVARGVVRGVEGCPVCCSCRSCKTTPPFWMPALLWMATLRAEA